MREVLLHPARQMPEATVTVEREHGVADALDEVAVVRGDDERGRPGVEQVLQRGQGVGVEVVRRLVEQEHVGLAGEQAQHLQPPPLAAGQVRHRCPQATVREPEHLGQLRRGEVPPAQVHPPRDLLHRLQHAGRSRQLGQFLGQERAAHGGALQQRSRVGPNESGQYPQQCGLARAVGPEDADPVARADGPVHIGQ
jgi:hypothetical protein